MKKFVLAAALCIAAATPALARPAVCIRQDNIRNWTALNDRQIVLEDYNHHKALLKLIGTCSGFRFSEALVIRSPGAMGLSCVEIGDTIVTHQGIGGRCAITSVMPYDGPMTTHGDHHDDHDSDHHDDGDHHSDHGSY